MLINLWRRRRMVSQWSHEQVCQAKPVLIDVRPLEEIRKNGGTIPHSICIPLADLAHELSLPPASFLAKYGMTVEKSTTPLVFFCQAGVRGMKGAQIAESLGYEKAGCYAGSWSEWCQRGGPKQTV